MLLKDIYKKYSPLPNLQDHMLRVGAIVSIIVNASNEEIIENTGFSKKDLIIIALLHDIAKIIEINLDITAKMYPSYTQETINNAKQVQQTLRKQLGNNHSCGATLIFEELKLPAKYSAAVSLIKFRYLYFVYKNKIIPNYILNYADMRVSPYQTTTLLARFLEGQKRFLEKSKRLKDNVNFDHLYKQALTGKITTLPDEVYANPWTKLQFTSALKIEQFIFAKIIKQNKLKVTKNSSQSVGQPILTPLAITENLVQQEITRQNFLEWDIQPSY